LPPPPVTAAPSLTGDRTLRIWVGPLWTRGHHLEHLLRLAHVGRGARHRGGAQPSWPNSWARSRSIHPVYGHRPSASIKSWRRCSGASKRRAAPT